MGWYTARDLERYDATYFRFPPGWHIVETDDGEWQALILVSEDGKILEMQCRRKP